MDKNINDLKVFKSDNILSPNILFCNCGHLCLCEGCFNVYKI